MLKRDALGFPSFWPAQVLGWGYFYLLLLASNLPSLKKPGNLWVISISVLSMFAASCVLRVPCRALVRRDLPWISLETRAFVLSLLAGAASGLAHEWSIGHWQGAWDWLSSTVHSTMILFLWCNLYFSVKHWQQSARERERGLRIEAQARYASLRALRYQLNPHFLFNSLNAVSTLVLAGKASAATRTLAQLAELLRAVLRSDAQSEIPLSEEIAFIERYLAIEQIRLGDRLRVEVAIPEDTLDALVPNMLLQPLVENAVRHGVAPLIASGTIRIESSIHDARLRIRVANSGLPSAPHERPKPPSNGVGLSNTVQRLETLYAAKHKFELQWPEAGGCEVKIELPYRKAPAQAGVMCAS
jgi:two-component system LytT family sensor kinase